MKINDVIFDKETDMAEITVSFISELISVVKNSDGEILEGDEKQSKRQKDVWTFSKDIKSQDPVWFLVATGE
jgi:predicted lipid-binding transport protein (Tim44 family)